MEKKKVFILCAAIAATASFVTGLFVYFYQTSSARSTDLDYDAIKKYMEIRDLEEIINENFYREVDSAALITGTLKGMTQALDDPYSVYYTEDEYKEYNRQSEEDLHGIGITAGPYMNTGELKVERVYSGSPAADAGILKNDVITAVDGTPVKDLDYESALNLLKGPAGSSLRVTLYTGEEPEREVELARAKVDAQTVTYTMLEGGIAWIIISEFNGNCAEDFKKALEFAKDSDARGMIIDIRGNMDGSVANAVEMLDEIVPEGVVTYTMDKNGAKDEFTVDGAFYDLPLVVLADENTASAAEVFAGAVQDRGRGIVVGENTYGKGVVQIVQEMPYYSGGGVKLTNAVYYTPAGSLINGNGISPDVLVSIPPGITELNEETDTQLKEAAAYLTGSNG